jgi:hypothetical protein
LVESARNQARLNNAGGGEDPGRRR